MAFDFAEELKKLPSKPGVYLMRDARDEVIYVGKAVSLKNRVKQYFQKNADSRLKIKQMMPKVARFEVIVTDSEVEALVLECNLIKEYRPKYNTMLMDDKSYPFIRVTVQETYPRLLYAHRQERDRARYFGPYPHGGAVKETIDLLRRLYSIRVCSRRLPEEQGKDRPCLYYHIHQCKAPCQGWISPEDYGEQVSRAIDFLGGKTDAQEKEIKAKMDEASEGLRFEEAAAQRDLLASIRAVAEHQKMTMGNEEDRDVIACAVDGADAIVQVFFVRGGKLIGRDHFYLKTTEGEEMGETLQSFVKQFYAGTPFIPRELMLSDAIEDVAAIEDWLSEKKEQRVYVRIPQKGKKEKLVDLARRNAELLLAQDRERIKKELNKTLGAIAEIGDWLSVAPPERMEAYDISNTSGFQSVGSMVVYENGRPKKADYRKFRIKSVDGPNDFASLAEVLHRRFTRALTRDAGFEKLPDLILMDGGKGQVHAAEKALSELGLAIPVCGMVKDDRHRTRGLYYLDQEIPIDTGSEGFHLITRIQDEAHRFAIEYHRSLRGKEQVHSILDDIPNVGPRRRKELIRHFAGIEELRAASVDELAAIPGMDRRAAESVYEFFHEEEKR